MSAVRLLGRRFAVAALTASLQHGDLDATPPRDRARRILMLQRVEGRAHHVVRVRRAERLRHHVLHAERLEHRAHRAAGDDAGAGRRRAQMHAARAMAETDPALLVADDHQRGKAEPAAALDHLGDAIDVDELVDELARLAVTATVPTAFSPWFMCHNDLLSVRAIGPTSSR